VSTKAGGLQIVLRHSRSCASRAGGRCCCAPSYQAQAWSTRDRRTIRKTFPSLGAARAWRQETQVALRRGSLRAATPATLKQAAEDWLTAAKQGVIRTRSGDSYKPSALRSYQQVLHQRVLPHLGNQRLRAIDPNTLQDLADRLLAEGLAPSTIRNTLLPVRALYRRAQARGEVAVNQTLRLALPAVRGRR
jgi:site-specific recombinase XerD